MEGYFSHLLENPPGLSWSWRIKDAKCCFIPGQRNSKLAIHRKMYIPKYCPISWPRFPPAVGCRQLRSAKTEDGTAPQHQHVPLSMQKKKHFGMQGLLPNTATLHHWTSQPGKWSFSSWRCLWASLTLRLSGAAPKCSGCFWRKAREAVAPRAPGSPCSWVASGCNYRPWNAKQQFLVLRGPGENKQDIIYTLKGGTHPNTTARQPDKHWR